MEREISATRFKAHCLKLLDEVAETGKPIVVTKRGRPVAKVTKAGRNVAPAMGGMAGTAEEVGDIVNFDTSGLWECLR
jgi:prevent-host-death family protein